jgi:large subunit ribosomal protein L10
MLTKAQKKQHVELGESLLKKSKTLVFADFTGVDTDSVRRIKVEVRKAGATFKVIKKRLLRIALKNSGVDFDPMQFPAQVGTFYISEDLSSVAASIFKFAKDLVKEKKDFKVLGAYDLVAKVAIPVAEFNAVAKLPGREVLLSMVLGAITGPLRAFMYLAQEIAKKPARHASQGDADGQAVPTPAVAAATPVAAAPVADAGTATTVEQK